MTFTSMPDEQRMTNDDIAPRIEAFIRERFRVPADDERFSRTGNLWEEGYLDSTGVVELVAFLESAFEVALPDEVLFDPSFASIDGMARIVGAHISRTGRCSNESATTTPGTNPV